MLTELNQFLFTLMNAPFDAANLTILFATFCAQYLIYLPVVAIAFYWLKTTDKRELISQIILTIIITLLFTMILRSLIHSPRPFAIAFGTNFLAHSASNSLPSQHAAFIFAIVFSLFYTRKNQPVGNIVLFSSLTIALLISWARIYLGVHWPLDILAAALLALITASLVNRYWQSIKSPIMALLLTCYRVVFYPMIKLGITKY